MNLSSLNLEEFYLKQIENFSENLFFIYNCGNINRLIMNIPETENHSTINIIFKPFDELTIS